MKESPDICSSEQAATAPRLWSMIQGHPTSGTREKEDFLPSPSAFAEVHTVR